MLYKVGYSQKLCLVYLATCSVSRVVLRPCHRLLTLARALLQQQPDRIVSRLSHTMIALQCTNIGAMTPAIAPAMESATMVCKNPSYLSESHSVQSVVPIAKSTGHIQRRRSKQPDKLMARYRTPVWFVNWAWGVELSNSQYGWTFSLRTYYVRPWNAPGFVLSRNRNVGEDGVEAFQELLATKQVSIFDVTELGSSLLQVRF